MVVHHSGNRFSYLIYDIHKEKQLKEELIAQSNKLKETVEKLGLY